MNYLLFLGKIVAPSSPGSNSWCSFLVWNTEKFVKNRAVARQLRNSLKTSRKDLSSNLTLKYSAREYDSITFSLIKELNNKQVELENALDSLENDIIDYVDEELFNNYKEARYKALEKIENFIINDKKQESANDEFKIKFEVQDNLSQTTEEK